MEEGFQEYRSENCVNKVLLAKVATISFEQRARQNI